jgi:methyl-accepting chemotaxis protein
VADAVRTLAKRSADAARETTDMIERSLAGSREGKEKVASVVASFKESTHFREEAKQRSEQIAESSVQQKTGIEHIAQAIEQMRSAVQITAANTEEMAASNQEMSAQADALEEVVIELDSILTGKSL